MERTGSINIRARADRTVRIQINLRYFSTWNSKMGRWSELKKKVGGSFGPINPTDQTGFTSLLHSDQRLSCFKIGQKYPYSTSLPTQLKLLLAPHRNSHLTSSLNSFLHSNCLSNCFWEGLSLQAPCVNTYCLTKRSTSSSKL